MTCLGTIQTNRKGLPKHFTSTENRPVGDYQVLYDEGSSISIHSLIVKNKSGNSMWNYLFYKRYPTFAVRAVYQHLFSLLDPVWENLREKTEMQGKFKLKKIKMLLKNSSIN